MKNRFFLAIALSLISSSCSEKKYDKEEMAHEDMSASRIEDSVCVNKNQPNKNICRPNIYRFFSHPDELKNKKINFVSYAVYGSQGGLLIYPSVDAACHRLEYSAIKLILSGDTPVDISDRLKSNGVARVELVGKVSEDDDGDSAPEIASIEVSFMRTIKAPETILLRDTNGLSKEKIDMSFFGEIKQESCFESRKVH